jgi:hypothetical protein
MLYLRTKIMKWKRKWKKKPKHTKIDDFSDQLFDAIHENDFELAKIIIQNGISLFPVRIFPYFILQYLRQTL